MKSSSSTRHQNSQTSQDPTQKHSQSFRGGLVSGCDTPAGMCDAAECWPCHQPTDRHLSSLSHSKELETLGIPGRLGMGLPSCSSPTRSSQMSLLPLHQRSSASQMSLANEQLLPLVPGVIPGLRGFEISMDCAAQHSFAVRWEVPVQTRRWIWGAF